MYKVSREAYIKFEQGYKQEAFAQHLFELCRVYCFMQAPGKRLELRGPRIGEMEQSQVFGLQPLRTSLLRKYGSSFTNTVPKQPSHPVWYKTTSLQKDWRIGLCAMALYNTTIHL